FADPARIEIERRKDLAQRLYGRGIKLTAVMDVERGGPAGGEALLDQRVELPRELMKRHVAAAIGVEQDQIVEFVVAAEEHPSIAGAVAHALGLAQAEIGLGGGDDAGVDLHRGDRSLRHETPEIGGDRAA